MHELDVLAPERASEEEDSHGAPVSSILGEQDSWVGHVAAMVGSASHQRSPSPLMVTSNVEEVVDLFNAQEALVKTVKNGEWNGPVGPEPTRCVRAYTRR